LKIMRRSLLAAAHGKIRNAENSRTQQLCENSVILIESFPDWVMSKVKRPCIWLPNSIFDETEVAMELLLNESFVDL
jgi:hypothetical protein